MKNKILFVIAQPVMLVVILAVLIILALGVNYPKMRDIIALRPVSALTTTPTSTKTYSPISALPSTSTSTATLTPTATIPTTTAPPPKTTSLSTVSTQDVAATETALARMIMRGISGTQTAIARNWTATPTVTRVSTPTPTHTRMAKATPTPTVSTALDGGFVREEPFDLRLNDLGIGVTWGWGYGVEDRMLEFTWKWSGDLKEEEFFELRIWRSNGPHWGGAPSTKEMKTDLGIGILTGRTEVPTNRSDLRDATQLCASVAVVTTAPYASLSQESKPVCWNYNDYPAPE